MKGSPVLPGGPLMSTPTRLHLLRVPGRVGFFWPHGFRAILEFR